MKWLATLTTILATLACLAVAPFAVGQQRVSVIPQLVSVEAHSGVFAIRAGTRLPTPRDPRAARVARYFATLLEQTRGIKLAMSGGVVGEQSTLSAGAQSIIFKLDAPGSNPEAYSIDVSAKRIVLSAGDPRGLLYAAVTLWQLCTTAQSDSAPITVPAMKITDHPRFPWRGLLLDSARHYQSPEFILQLIDWMALHKLNVLHWHLTDDQGWRLEIKKYPRLTSVGAWRGSPSYGGFYSQETVRRIVAHGLERNVTIVPEIDMPGHATAAIVAYPRLASVVPAAAVITAKWGIFSNLYNVDEDTFAFLQDVMAEVVQLFPGKYIHVGGDEALKDQWKASPGIQARMRALGVPNEAALQSYFIGRLGKMLAAHHRRLIGWDEILEGGIPPDATVMSWRGVEGAQAAAAAGHDAVLSPAPTLYFDHVQSAIDSQPGRSEPITLEDVYKFEPLPASLPVEQRFHILGVQANVWTEHIRTEQRVEYMTFPRAAAIAEVGWSAAGTLDWNGFQTRLRDQMNRYRILGIHAYSDASAAAAAPQSPLKRSSHQLQSCTHEILLSLEDDAPPGDQRAAFKLDIMNPCWIWPGADLSRVSAVRAAVGQLPFEFELGADVHLPKLDPPQTPSGELEVRLDGCQGQSLVVLSLAPASANPAVTELPAAKLPHVEGRHDLCLKFAQGSADPLWVVDWVQLLE